MSYGTAQIEKANEECRHLGGRQGEGTLMGDRWIINPDFGGNPACAYKEYKKRQKERMRLGSERAQYEAMKSMEQ